MGLHVDLPEGVFGVWREFAGFIDSLNINIKEVNQSEMVDLLMSRVLYFDIDFCIFLQLFNLLSELFLLFLLLKGLLDLWLHFF